MRSIRISSEENYVIFAEECTDSLRDLNDKSEQLRVLKRIYSLLDGSSPQHYIYETIEGCDELEVIRVGGNLRIFCRLVMGIPNGDKAYNILFAFYIDPHTYDQRRLQRLDGAARVKLGEINELRTVDDVDDYLEAMNAFTTEDVKARIDRA